MEVARGNGNVHWTSHMMMMMMIMMIKERGLGDGGEKGGPVHVYLYFFLRITYTRAWSSGSV